MWKCNLDAMASSEDRPEPIGNKNDIVGSDCPVLVQLSDSSRPALRVMTAGNSIDNQHTTTNLTPPSVPNNLSDVASEVPSGSISLVDSASVVEVDRGTKDTNSRPECDQSVPAESHPAPTSGDSRETEVGTVERETSNSSEEVATRSRCDQLLASKSPCIETDDSLAICESNLLEHISLVQDAVENRLSLIEKQVAGNGICPVLYFTFH